MENGKLTHNAIQAIERRILRELRHKGLAPYIIMALDENGLDVMKGLSDGVPPFKIPIEHLCHEIQDFCGPEGRKGTLEEAKAYIKGLTSAGKVRFTVRLSVETEII